eukprot:m.178349 g.178349  ORF g.178349 m.178349 type:complete len:1398 (+) comp10447_c1_seq4:3-4196(+)
MEDDDAAVGGVWLYSSQLQVVPQTQASLPEVITAETPEALLARCAEISPRRQLQLWGILSTKEQPPKNPGFVICDTIGACQSLVAASGSRVMLCQQHEKTTVDAGQLHLFRLCQKCFIRVCRTPANRICATCDKRRFRQQKESQEDEAPDTPERATSTSQVQHQPARLESSQSPATGERRKRPSDEGHPRAQRPRSSPKKKSTEAQELSDLELVDWVADDTDAVGDESSVIDVHELDAFLRQSQYTPLIIQRQDVPPLRLVELVLQEGGYSKVCTFHRWSSIIRELGLTSTGASFRVKNFYREYLLQFEAIHTSDNNPHKEEPLQPLSLVLDESVKMEEQLQRLIGEIVEHMPECQLKQKLAAFQKELEELQPAKVALLAPNKTGKSLLLDLMLLITERGQFSYKEQASDMTALDRFLRELCEMEEDEDFSEYSFNSKEARRRRVIASEQADDADRRPTSNDVLIEHGEAKDPSRRTNFITQLIDRQLGRLDELSEWFLLPSLGGLETTTTFTIDLRHGNCYAIVIEYEDLAKLIADMKQPQPDDRRSGKAWRKQLQHLTGTPKKGKISVENMAEKALKDPELTALSGKVHVFRGNGNYLRNDQAFVAQRLSELRLSRVAAMVKRVTIFCPCSVVDGVVLQDVAGTDDCNPFNEFLRQEALLAADAVFVMLNKGLGATSSVVSVLQEELLHRCISAQGNSNPVVLRLLLSLETGSFNVADLHKSPLPEDHNDKFLEEWDDVVEDSPEVEFPSMTSLRFLRFATLALIAACQQSNQQLLHTILSADCSCKDPQPDCSIKELVDHCADRKQLENTNGHKFLEFLESAKRAKTKKLLKKFHAELDQSLAPANSPQFAAPQPILDAWSSLYAQWAALRERNKRPAEPPEFATRVLRNVFRDKHKTLEDALAELEQDVKKLELNAFVDRGLLKCAEELQRSVTDRTTPRVFYITAGYKKISKQLLSKLNSQDDTVAELALKCQNHFIQRLTEGCVEFFAAYVCDCLPDTGASTRSSSNEDHRPVISFVESVLTGMLSEYIKGELHTQFRMERVMKAVRFALFKSFKNKTLPQFLSDFCAKIAPVIRSIVNDMIQNAYKKLIKKNQNFRRIWSAVLNALCTASVTQAAAPWPFEKLHALAAFVKQQLSQESNATDLLDQLLQHRYRAEINLERDFSNLQRTRRPLTLLQQCTTWSSGPDLEWLPGNVKSFLSRVRESQKVQTSLLTQLLIAVASSHGFVRKHDRRSVSCSLVDDLRTLALLQLYSLSPGQLLLSVSFERLRELLQAGKPAQDLTVAEAPAIVYLLAQGLQCAFVVGNGDSDQHIFVRTEGAIDTSTEKVYALVVRSLSAVALLRSVRISDGHEVRVFEYTQDERRSKQAAAAPALAAAAHVRKKRRSQLDRTE